MPDYTERKIISFTERVPSAERTDSDEWLLGDTRYITLECGHVIHGSPIMTYRVGDYGKCRECSC
jgi:hypothetical protein